MLLEEQPRDPALHRGQLGREQRLLGVKIPALLPRQSSPTASWDRARSHGVWFYFSRVRAVPVFLWLSGWSEHHHGVGSFLAGLGGVCWDVLEQGRCTQAAPPRHSWSCGI